MKRFSLIALLLVLVMTLSLFAGCSDGDSGSTNTPAGDSGSSGNTGDTGDTGDGDTGDTGIQWGRYPIVTDGSVTLEAWWPTSNVLVTDPAETTPFIEGQKRTGINWTFQTPANGSEAEQFSMMLNSLDYPDLIKSFGSYYTKGFDYAVEDEIIVPLEDYLYAMPDIDYWRSSTELIEKSLTTDGGHFAGIPMFLIGSEDHLAQGAYSGYVVRTDWLNDLGLEVPDTYAELETVLSGMQQYCENPLDVWPNADTYALVAGYNIVSPYSSFFGPAGGWVVRNNTVEYTLFDDNYRAYIEMMNDWYNKGYMANDYYTAQFDWANALTDVSNNNMGVWNMMYTWRQNYLDTSTSEGFDMVALPPFRISENDTIHVRSAGSGASVTSCVTTACEQPEMVCAYFNYFFSDEGIILGNYGVEGETFEYGEDGLPHYIDGYWDVVNEHDSSYAQSLLLVYLDPGFRWWDRELDGLDPDAVAMLAPWDSLEFCDSEWFYPSAATMTGDENTQYANIMSDIGTFVSENLTGFIIGANSLDQWDSFLDQIRSMGIEDALAIKQAAYDRYLAR